MTPAINRYDILMCKILLSHLFSHKNLANMSDVCESRWCAIGWRLSESGFQVHWETPHAYSSCIRARVTPPPSTFGRIMFSCSTECATAPSFTVLGGSSRIGFAKLVPRHAEQARTSLAPLSQDGCWGKSEWTVRAQRRGNAGYLVRVASVGWPSLENIEVAYPGSIFQHTQTHTAP